MGQQRLLPTPSSATAGRWGEGRLRGTGMAATVESGEAQNVRSREEGPCVAYPLLFLQHQEQCKVLRGHSISIVLVQHCLPRHPPTKMAAFGRTFPFYAGPKPTFPMDTTLAVIIIIFLTALVTFIIILPGIRGKMVRKKPSPGDPSPRETSVST